MSLVICSNFDQNYEFEDTQGRDINMKGQGTTNPASFTNHFSNVFTIPRNAEVAVQSVKINRNNVLRINHPKFFSWFLGKPLTKATNYRHSCNLPVVVKVNPGKYGVLELGRKINEALMERGFDCHPDYNGNCEVIPHFSNLSTGDTWNGWRFTINTSGDQSALNNADSLLRWGEANNCEISDFAFQNTGPGAGVKITKVVNDPLTYVVGIGNANATPQDMPLSLMNGEFEIRPFQMGTTHSWECGLVRAVNRENPAPDWCVFEDALTEGSAHPAGFFDYKLTWTDDNTGTYRLYIEQAIVEEGGFERDKYGTANPGTFKMVETRYFGINGKSTPGVINIKLTETNCQDGLNTTGATTKYSRFKFVAKGERLELYAFGSNKNNPGGSWETIISDVVYKAVEDSEIGAQVYPDGTAVKVPTCFKPINTNCLNMYPKVGLDGNGEYIEITKWGGRAGSGDFPTYETPGTSLWARSWDSDVGGIGRDDMYGAVYDIKRTAEIDHGLMMNGIFDTAVYDPVLPDSNNEAPEYQLGILPQSHTQAGYKMDDYVYGSIMGNSAEMLGFHHQTAVLQTEQGQTFRLDGITSTSPPGPNWVLYSTQQPTLSSHTCFIRCPTLTHQSLNMAKELPSKILYHIPRFSNSGKEYGNLFYEPHEKTYLALKNTEELKLNELKIDIVNTDETIAEDLAGQTTIVLHFRKSRM